jgi:5-methylcytosine-specific restriction endonuclease McrA
MGIAMTLPKHTPKELVEQNAIDSLHLGHFIYYDHGKQRWKHHGYFCRYCDKIFKKYIRANHHLSCCKEYNRKPIYFVETYDEILDNKGKPWKPII